LLKALNDGVVSAAGVSPDDLFILIHEIPGENVSFAAAWLNALGGFQTQSQRLRTRTVHERPSIAE